jgi:hypothetical protein
MGTCGRTFFYAMPWALSAICTCFLQTWLILMPAATSVNSHPAAAAAAAAGAGSAAAYRLAPKLAVDMMLYSLACAMLLGVDEVAAQLEQPFPFVPMIDMADATLRAVERCVRCGAGRGRGREGAGGRGTVWLHRVRAVRAGAREAAARADCAASDGCA